MIPKRSRSNLGIDPEVIPYECRSPDVDVPDVDTENRRGAPVQQPLREPSLGARQIDGRGAGAGRRERISRDRLDHLYACSMDVGKLVVDERDINSAAERPRIHPVRSRCELRLEVTPERPNVLFLGVAPPRGDHAASVATPSFVTDGAC